MGIVGEGLSQQTNSKHILSRGFCNDNDSKVYPFTQNYINTTLRIFRSEEWQKLHNLLGDKMIYHLIKFQFMFIKLKRNNFLQISGYDITKLKSSLEYRFYVKEHINRNINGYPTIIYKMFYSNGLSKNGSSRKRKREQYENEQNEINIDINTANKRRCTAESTNDDSAIHKIKKPRLSIWRRRALKKKSQKMEIEGCEEAKPTDVKGTNNNIKKDKDGELYMKNHIAKDKIKATLNHKEFKRDIFYSSPFSGPTGLLHEYILCKLNPTDYDAIYLAKYIFSITKKSLPKRLYKFIRIGKAIIKRTLKCRVLKILRDVCTIKNQTTSGSEHVLDLNNITLENYSELVNYYIPHQNVSQFIIKVIYKIFPPQTFGSFKNWEKLKLHIFQFIKLGRYEKMNTSNILQGFSINDISWLRIDRKNENHHLPPSDSLKRNQIFIDFLYWLFDDFICSLLRNNFFCTETGHHGQKTFYYRKDIWKEIHTKCLEDSVQKNILSPISKKEFESILKSRDNGFSYIRFLPNEKKLRPIINMSRKNSNPFHPEVNSSINHNLKKIHSILSFEKETYSHIVGHCIFTHQEFFERLIQFKMKLRNTKEPFKLFFVKADISKAYDRIIQDKLFNILENSLHLDHYLLYTYNETRFFNEKCSHMRKHMIFNPPDFPQITVVADTLANKSHNTIISDNAFHSYISKKCILDQIKQHINDNLIKSGNNYYRNCTGISQGSCLSSLLCAIYYGDMENKEFKRFLTPDSSKYPNAQCALFRWVDDFLYITTSSDLANSFVESLEKGYPEYGCVFNKDKTTLNFKYSGEILSEEYSDSLNINGNEWFSWCGFYVNTKTLEVKKVASTKPDDEYLMTISFTRPGLSLESRLFKIIQRNLSPLLFDLGLNSLKIICLNMINLFFECANKMLYYIDRLHSLTIIDKNINDQFFIGIVHDAISGVSKIIKTRRLNLNLCEEEILYIGLYAFYHKLKINTKLLNVSLYLKSLLKETKRSLFKCKFKNKLCIKWAMQNCKI